MTVRAKTKRTLPLFVLKTINDSKVSTLLLGVLLQSFHYTIDSIPNEGTLLSLSVICRTRVIWEEKSKTHFSLTIPTDYSLLPTPSSWL